MSLSPTEWAEAKFYIAMAIFTVVTCIWVANCSPAGQAQSSPPPVKSQRISNWIDLYETPAACIYYGLDGYGRPIAMAAVPRTDDRPCR